MKRFIIKTFVQKALDKSGKVKVNLEKLKAEVIKILKQKEEFDVKKAITELSVDDLRYSHLEKSINGEWIEKAGYGVGTVRIWKGKKYKKISTSPTKWVRVFDKNDRGAATSMGRYIAQVKKCQSVEELYNFCMKQRSLFQDENGVDLPIMDKLRTAIDEQGGKIERGEINTDSKKITKEDFNKLVDKYLKSEREVINNPKMQIYYNDFSEKTREELINDNLDFLHNHPKGNPELQAKGIARQLLMAERYENEHKKESVKETYWIKDKGNNRITSEDAKNRIKSNLSQIDAYNNLIENSDKADAIKWNSKKNQLEDDNKYLMDRLKPDDKNEIIENYLNEKKQKEERELNMSNAEINSLTDIDYLKDLQKKVVKENNRLHSEKKYDEANDMARRNYVISDRIKQLESEQEKHQNRSEAMKGNQNAYKGGSKEDLQNQLIKITEDKQKNLKKIKDLHDEMNKLKESKALSKNKVKIIKIEKNGYVKQEDDSDLDLVHNFKERVKQLNYPIVFDDYGNGISHLWITVPEDEVNDVKSKLSHKSIKVYEENEKHFNDDYEGIIDYEDLLDEGYNKLKPKYNKLENDTELKNLQKEINDLEDKNYQLEKDGNELSKEISNMSSDYVDTGVANIVKTTDATMDNKEPIAKATKVADGKVTIPNDPAVKNQMKQLIASRYTDYVGNTSYGDMLSEVYYDGENLVSTDAKVLKVIKIGKLDGIEPNKYVKIDISGKDNISINQMDKKVGQYPNYKRVIPNGNDQTFAIDNKLAKEKIEAMKRDGSILKKDGKIALEFDGDAIKLDGTVIGKTYGTKLVGNDYIAIQADYILNVLGKNGEETNFNASENPQKALTVTTNVSTDVIMPMVAEKPDYEQNRKDFKENQEFESERKAEAEKVKSEQDSRRIKAETKKELIGNRPDGIDADEYSSMIDFADDFYVKLGYDNSGERAYGMIKRMVDNAINQVNSKDYDFEEVLLNSDNKVSRKIFEMLTGERVGSNKQTAKKAWENWVGQEAVDAHNKKIADEEKAKKDKQAAEQKAKDDAEREQYHGFMDGKTPAGKGKAKDVLGKKANFNGKVMSWQELADQYIAEGGHARASTYVTNGGKEKPYYSISNKDGLGYEVPKTVYDYAMHISNGVKKSIADIIMLDEYEHEDFDEDFEDNDATQPDLFNSPAYKVSAALDSVFGCR